MSDRTFQNAAAAPRPPLRFRDRHGFDIPLYNPRHPILRAWTLAWGSKDAQRSRDAWWLCWHLAARAGWHASGPGGVLIPGGAMSEGPWLMPPGSPFRLLKMEGV